VHDYVLLRAPASEEKTLLENVARAADVLPVLLAEGAAKAMNRLHSASGKVVDGN
jgi:peptidyl-tRNA hydrolase